jgi:hypothetical protein
MPRGEKYGARESGESGMEKDDDPICTFMVDLIDGTTQSIEIA